jgi:hypothetical protein
VVCVPIHINRHCDAGPVHSCSTAKQQRCCDPLAVVAAAEKSQLLDEINAFKIDYTKSTAATNEETNSNRRRLLEELWQRIDDSSVHRNDLAIWDALADIDEVKDIPAVQIRALQDRDFADALGLDADSIAESYQGHEEIWKLLANHPNVNIDHATENIWSNEEIMLAGCQTNPNWAKKLPDALLEKKDFLTTLLERSPAALCYIPPRAFQPGQPLHWTPGNQFVAQAWKNFFHHKRSSAILTVKLARRQPIELWSNEAFLRCWFEWGGGIQRCDFLRDTEAYVILQRHEREFMELMARHCARNHWARLTFDAFASAELKSNKTLMMGIVNIRPYLLEFADLALQLDPDLLAMAVSVSPNFFAYSDVGTYGQENGRDPWRAINILKRGISDRKFGAAVFAAIEKRPENPSGLPRDILQHISEGWLSMSTFATASTHLKRFLQNDCNATSAGGTVDEDFIADEDRSNATSIMGNDSDYEALDESDEREA